MWNKIPDITTVTIFIYSNSLEEGIQILLVDLDS